LNPPPSIGTRTWTVTSRVGVAMASRSDSSRFSRSAARSKELVTASNAELTGSPPSSSVQQAEERTLQLPKKERNLE